MAKHELQAKFEKEIIPQLQKELNTDNPMAIPRIGKIKVSVGIGTYVKSQSKDFSHIVDNLTAISGQKPIVTKAKKAVSNFKTRIGDPVGLTVTVRGERMYDLIGKLVNVVFPRVRDFRGISPKSFDGQGNYSFGFKEQTVFPEISPDDLTKNHGLQITISTTARNDEEGLALLKAFGFPFKKTN